MSHLPLRGVRGESVDPLVRVDEVTHVRPRIPGFVEIVLDELLNIVAVDVHDIVSAFVELIVPIGTLKTVERSSHVVET